MRVLRLIAVSLLIVALIGSAEQPALAHVLQSNNGIKAVLHVMPDDLPVSNEDTSFELLFGDDARRFDARGCLCEVTVSKNGRSIGQQTLRPLDAMRGQGNVVFPSAGVYTLQVQGAPRQAGAFASFSLSYNLRVEQKAKTVSPLLAVGIGTLVGVTLVGGLYWLLGSRFNNRRSSRS